MTRFIVVLLAFGLTLFFTANITSAKSITIKKDDTLLEIAKANHTTIEELLAVNKLDSLVTFAEQPVLETYEVVKGDTLYWLAKDFNTTVDLLMEINDLNSSLILIGQQLKVHKDSHFEKTKQAEVVKTKSFSSEVETDEQSQVIEGRTMTVTATAYTAECDGCSGITYTGVNLLQDRQAKVIAVDPNVIPLGSRVYVEGYGYAMAEDIGSAIKGNRIDIHVPTKDEAYTWGVKEVSITIIED